MIGYLFFTMQEIKSGTKEWSFKSKRKKNQSAGELKLENFGQSPFYDFVDYL